MYSCKQCNKSFDRKSSDVSRGRIHFCSMECSRIFRSLKADRHAEIVLRKGRKQCKMCNRTRKLQYFPKSKKSKTGYGSYCYECNRAINRVSDDRRRHSVARKAWSRAAYLKRTYGMTQEEYEKLEKSQEGGCAICGGVTRLAIDHCHKTGKVRGLLCHNCNRGLGMFADNKERLTNAISYLR